MIISVTKFPQCLIITTEVFEDFRGDYVESYHQEKYQMIFSENDIPPLAFIQDDFSFSHKGVLRGIHGDDKTWKLISCPQGEIYYVVTCCDKESEQFGQWQSFIISGSNRKQVLVPPKHGAAFLALTNCTFHYKQSTYYENCKQFTYAWDEEKFNIYWPLERLNGLGISQPIMSNRDKEVKRIDGGQIVDRFVNVSRF